MRIVTYQLGMLPTTRAFLVVTSPPPLTSSAYALQLQKRNLRSGE